MVYGDKMKEQNKQYVLSALSWLNIFALAPIIFFTAIYNAQVYVFKIHTEEASNLLFAYAAQIVLLLSLFVAALILQFNVKRKIKRQALLILACESAICFVYSIWQFFSQQHIEIYGWILRYFLTSYTGVILFALNIVGATFYLYGLKIKKNITKFVMVNVFLFTVCLVYIQFIK